MNSTYLFFFNDTTTTEIYTLSLHDALPIYPEASASPPQRRPCRMWSCARKPRSEEHTSELQSRGHLVCRLLLEKKKAPLQRSLASYRLRDALHLLTLSEPCDRLCSLTHAAL